MYVGLLGSVCGGGGHNIQDAILLRQDTGGGGGVGGEGRWVLRWGGGLLDESLPL